MNRDKYFKPDKCIPISAIKGFGIYDNVNKTFIGFNTNKGFLTVWNESKKAKLAFAYHTGNTIDERKGKIKSLLRVVLWKSYLVLLK